MLWQDLACRGSNKETTSVRDRKEIIWEQMVVVEKARREVKLQNNIEENIAGATFLLANRPQEPQRYVQDSKEPVESEKPLLLVLFQTKIRVSQPDRLGKGGSGWRSQTAPINSSHVH